MRSAWPWRWAGHEFIDVLVEAAADVDTVINDLDDGTEVRDG